MNEIFLYIICFLIIVNIIVSILKNKKNNEVVFKSQLENVLREITKIDPIIRNEFSLNREELQTNSKNIREEIGNSFKTFGEFVTKGVHDLVSQQNIKNDAFSTELKNDLNEKITDLKENQKKQNDQICSQIDLFKKINEEKLEKLIVNNHQAQKDFTVLTTKSFTENRVELNKYLKDNDERINKLISRFDESTKNLNIQLLNSAKDNRDELTKSLKLFQDSFSQNVKEFNEIQRQKFSDLLSRQDQFKLDNETKLEKIRETVEKRLQTLQEENVKKLDEMRNTVDEKLQSTLEKRFNDSFTIISERLEAVHKGLGEMQSLAINVGDLKKVMTNVKSRGVMGEYQLANILEDLMPRSQYESNVKTNPMTGAIVEFAIKMPHNSIDETRSLWLPIDSKYPIADYQTLVDAYDDGDSKKIDELRKAFKNSIIKSAKEIRDKYISPPNTTEYGIMFLPFESLYAEVLRTPGLFELLQKAYKITITGPTTLSALLSSLYMGFRTLAIEKRSSEVWDLLSAVKHEFNQFGVMLEKTKKKLQEATNTIDKASVRSRAVEKQLKGVQDSPSIEITERINDEVEHVHFDAPDIIQNLLFPIDEEE